MYVLEGDYHVLNTWIHVFAFLRITLLKNYSDNNLCYLIVQMDFE